MSVDDLVKLMLAAAVAFAIAGIAFQLMRLIGKLADSLQDLRRTWKNVSKVSDLAVEDYMSLRNGIRNITGIISNFNDGFLVPIKAILTLFNTVKKRKSGDREAESVADIDEE